MHYFYLVLSLLLIAAGGWGAAGEWPRLGMTFLFLGLGLGGHSVKSMWNSRRPRLLTEGIREDEAELLAESYQKAVTDYRYLEQARKELEDRELVLQLGKMQHISHNMLSYLEKHPQKIHRARRFIDYYQDHAAELVRKYQELEATELATERVTELKTRMKTALSGFDEVYARQFEQILNDQMMTTDAELTVMEQHLDSQGIRIEEESSSDAGESQLHDGGSFSVDGFLKSLREESRHPRRGKVSIVPPEEKSDVVKHKVIQSALAIFLGMFGAHKFYQGKNFIGVLYALFFWTSIPMWVGIVEGIRYLMMPVDDFYLEYYRDD